MNYYIVEHTYYDSHFLGNEQQDHYVLKSKHSLHEIQDMYSDEAIADFFNIDFEPELGETIHLYNIDVLEV